MSVNHLLATRDALAEVLAAHRVTASGGCVCGWTALRDEPWMPAYERHQADVLAGVVRDPATLADDEGLVERATRNRFRDAGAKVYPGDFDVTRHALRALAAALTGDPS